MHSIRLARRFATATSVDGPFKSAQSTHGFTLQRVKEIRELKLTAYQFQHDRTKAQYLHVAKDDSNNVFSIGFKTIPPDDTGVPHILEHTTLCGSRRYPVRDPFFRMLPRSMQNFMNAFTSLDHTTYLFSTTNEQDYKNLMSVYLDATLRPLLNANDFYQEGWRIGPVDPRPSHDQIEHGKNLAFKGVVYNEMKGAMSDAESIYLRRFVDYVLPELHNSAGDPEKMTDLSYEQLKAFHADHYHPSNAKIFTYGNTPFSEHMEQISANLSGFDEININRATKLPINLDNGPIEVTVEGPSDPLVPLDTQYKVSVSWVMCNTNNVVEMFALGVLSSLLMDGYGSPLFRGLIDVGLGPEFTSNTGLHSQAAKAVFSIGLSGVKKENVPKVKEAVFATLRRVKADGFPFNKVEGILQQLELALKHKTAQFGLGLVERVQSSWFNGVDPFDALAWEDTISAFKTKYAEGNYLETLLEKYLLNDRTFTLIMEPKETYEQDRQDREATQLKLKLDEITQNSRDEDSAQEELQKRELELLEAQEAAYNQDLSCLPTLRTSDISRKKIREAVRDARIGDAEVKWREASTNGLTYFRAICKIDKLPRELRELIPLFCAAVMKLGTKEKSIEELEDLMKLKTGGINVGYHSSTSPLTLGDFEEGLIFSGYALDENVPIMYDILRTFIQDTDFSTPDAATKIMQLLLASANNAVNDIAESGHAYARRYAEAQLSSEASVLEQISGLAQVKLTASLASRMANEPLDDIISKLKTIQSLAFNKRNSMRIALTCEPQAVANNEGALAKFLEIIPSRTYNLRGESSDPITPRTSKTFFPLPYQVYYSGLAFPTVPYVDTASAPLQILSRLLSNGHLHHEIREKGGAYGGGAYSRSLGGLFGMFSYRDPNPQNTMEIFSRAGNWAVNRAWSEREMEEAKLSVFQNLDAPRSVSEEGMTQFLSGIDEDMEQTHRERLLDTTAEDVRAAAQRFMVDQFHTTSNIALIGAPTEWLNEKGGWTVHDLGVSTSPQ